MIKDRAIEEIRSRRRQILTDSYDGSVEKWIKGALNPFKWPMGFSKVVLGIPPHAKRPGQQSIYGNYLFVFAKDR